MRRDDRSRTAPLCRGARVQPVDRSDGRSCSPTSRPVQDGARWFLVDAAGPRPAGATRVRPESPVVASGFGAWRIAHDGRRRVGRHLRPADQRHSADRRPNTSTSRRGGPRERHAIAAGTTSRAGRGRDDRHRSNGWRPAARRHAPDGGREVRDAGARRDGARGCIRGVFQTLPRDDRPARARERAIATLVRLLGDPDAGAHRGMGTARAFARGARRRCDCAAPAGLVGAAAAPLRVGLCRARPSRRVARVAERRLAEARGHAGDSRPMPTTSGSPARVRSGSRS